MSSETHWTHDRYRSTGSFNWSRQAVIGNQENLVINRGGQIVGTSFSSLYQSLWLGTGPSLHASPHVLLSTGMYVAPVRFRAQFEKLWAAYER